MIVCTAGYVGKVSKMLVIFTVHLLVMLIIVVNAGRVANIGNVGCAGGLSNTDTQSWARTVFSLHRVIKKRLSGGIIIGHFGRHILPSFNPRTGEGPAMLGQSSFLILERGQLYARGTFLLVVWQQ